jgi:hypothetical protein
MSPSTITGLAFLKLRSAVRAQSIEVLEQAGFNAISIWNCRDEERRPHTLPMQMQLMRLACRRARSQKRILAAADFEGFHFARRQSVITT